MILILVVVRLVDNLWGGQICVILQSLGGLLMNSSAELYVVVFSFKALEIFGYDLVAKAAI
jgi:hypothetical protein